MSTVLEIENATISAPTAPTKRKIVKKAVVAKTTRVSAPRFLVPVNQLGVVDQVTVAFSKNNMLATIFGFILGGIVPAFVYEVGHFEVADRPWLWLLVIGGLLYSAITVYKWGAAAFSSELKSAGFVVLVEGVMTLSNDHYVSGAALGLLIAINKVATACNLIANRKESRKDARIAGKAVKS